MRVGISTIDTEVDVLLAKVLASTPMAGANLSGEVTTTEAYVVPAVGEKIFTVAPQQDAKQINIKLAGADKLEIGDKGELIAHTGNGPVSQRMLADYQSVYASSWKQAEPHADFIPGLISLCARKGWLRMGVARLQGRAIAVQLWMVAQGKVEIYKLAYDEAYKAYSPGTLLTQLLMQHVFEQDAAVEIDYLIGDDDYKRGWMSQRRERWGIIAFNPRTLGGLVGWSREAIGRQVRRIKALRAPAAAGAA